MKIEIVEDDALASAHVKFDQEIKKERNPNGNNIAPSRITEKRRRKHKKDERFTSTYSLGSEGIARSQQETRPEMTSLSKSRHDCARLQRYPIMPSPTTAQASPLLCHFQRRSEWASARVKELPFP